MGTTRVSRRSPFNRPASARRRIVVTLLWAITPLVAGWLGQFLTGQSPFATAAESDTPPAVGLPTSRDPIDARQLAATIDDYFAAYWQRHGIEPAAPADDAEFHRRVSLDLVGKIPSVGQARAFLDDSNPAKRAELIESLLTEGACATHFANLWRATLLGGAADDPQTRALTPRLETWLTLRLAANMPYDQLVRELLLAPMEAPARRAIQQQAEGVADPAAFYQASGGKPEQLAATSSRVFLGLQVQCAECHDHPHRHWKRKEFWSFAASFANLNGPAVTGADANAAAANDAAADDDGSASAEEKTAEAVTSAGLKIPDTEIIAPPVFLDGSTPPAASGPAPRVPLVHWLTSRDNAWFAQAATNRLWEQFFGRGLIDPADDLEAAGPNDHAELLAFVARQFEVHDFDLRYLVRAVTATRPYQFASRTNPSSPLERQHFARMPLRRMTGEQLVDSLIQATGLREPATPAARNQIFAADTLRTDFRQKFFEANVARTDSETTILQALSLMNGKLVNDAVDLAQGETLAAVVDAPFLTTPGKVEVLFLATLSRRPNPDEERQFVEYVESGGSKHDQGRALADVCWSLVNSAEFVLVH